MDDRDDAPEHKFMHGPANATSMFAVASSNSRLIAMGCHCTGLPQPKPPTPPPAPRRAADQREQQRADRIGVRERVERDPALAARRVVAELVAP